MAVTSWCDDTQAAEDALEFLRLEEGDPDEERIGRHAVEACGLISRFLDWACTPAALDEHDAALLRVAHGKLTAELYLRKDAPFGIANAFDLEGDSFRIGSDPLAGVRHLVSGMKTRWGVA